MIHKDCQEIRPIFKIAIVITTTVVCYAIVCLLFEHIYHIWLVVQEGDFYNIGLGFLAALTFLVHITWPITVSYTIYHITGVRSVPFLLLCYTALWIGTVLLYQGCPFSYVQEYLDIERGSLVVYAYSMEDSIVYRYFLTPIFWVTDTLISR